MKNLTEVQVSQIKQGLIEILKSKNEKEEIFELESFVKEIGKNLTVMTHADDIREFLKNEKMYYNESEKIHTLTQTSCEKYFIKRTALGKSYWSSNGAYQIEYDLLYKNSVNDCGSSDMIHGELLRAISRLFYEYCNNGNCNANDIQWGTENSHSCNCGDDCDCEDEEVIISNEVSSFYYKFLELIKKTIPYLQHQTEMIEDIITCAQESNINDSNMNEYNILCDEVIYYILHSHNSQLPTWYEKD